MTKKEFQTLQPHTVVSRVAGKRTLNKIKITNETKEITGKTEDKLIFADGTIAPYKDYRICEEDTEMFEGNLGYDYLRQRWVIGDVLYSVEGEWHYFWNHAYCRDITEEEKEKMRKYTKNCKDRWPIGPARDIL